jgi:hypothetical protein
MEGASRKKLRSKSMGPGSLDPLKSGTGNRRAVCLHRGAMCYLSMLQTLATNLANSPSLYPQDHPRDRS